MIKLYKYCESYSDDFKLREYEALRETQYYWIFPDPNNCWSKTKERREAKSERTLEKYYRTPEEAMTAFKSDARINRDRAAADHRKWLKAIEQVEKDLARL